jgi:hypothetical protein
MSDLRSKGAESPTPALDPNLIYLRVQRSPVVTLLLLSHYTSSWGVTVPHVGLRIHPRTGHRISALSCPL